ncbi:lamin tail domain-containing protein [Epilithonimonas mollis]|uniref:Listeria/Bacterioides repeat-containing protein n=1 Tax=Epilithonimonas mollis TaxID=216903 RepID=A0A1M6SBR5_9FLAO|nr:InlB B-repeat-containing protein [Epilithonimonas mollis]SHK41948.1 Listeria/Bacterioides repeat-containing protein [Epilithonimonas mollis]
MKTNLYSRKRCFFKSSLKFFSFFFLLLSGLHVSGQKLIISQVYEGASNDKWIEITNVGTSTIDMAAGGYKLGIWSVGGDTGNGAISGAPSSSIVLSGTLAAGASYLMRNSSASTTVPHNPMPTANSFNTSVAAFNGNDAVAIFTGTSTIVDAFGVGINNKDISYHRNANILSSNAAFTTSEWTTRTLAQIASATNTATEYIGKHIYGAVNYTLTYSGNGYTSGTLPAAVSNPSGTSITLPSTTIIRTGYIFSGWNASAAGNGLNYSAGASYSMPAAATTLYARWAYSITYNGNDNTGGSAPTAQTGYNSLATTLSGAGTLTRTGYTFGGWKTTSVGTTANYAAGVSYTHSGSNASVTLYAHWIPDTPIFHVSPASLSGFSYVESNGSSAVKSFILSGSNLENTDTDPVELITVDDKFEIAENTTGYWGHTIELSSAYTGAEKTIYVRLKAGLVANANYTDTILITGGGTMEPAFAEVNLSGSVSACLAPTSQSSVSSFASVTSSVMTVNLALGNGVGRIVKVNTTNSFTDPLSSDVLPAADAVYTGSGEQVVYAGTGNSVSVSGLSASTIYHYRVYEYNVCSGNYIYGTGTVTNNPRSQITACDLPATPNGEVTPSENPACGSTTLMYEHGTNQPQAGITYYWQTATNGTSTAFPVTSPYTATASGNYYVRAYNGFCWSNGSYVTQKPIAIITSASISTQPANQSGLAGDSVSFTVAASGSAPFSYQWQESLIGEEGSWVNIGSSSNTLMLNNVSLSKSGYKYRVIVSNDCGSKTSDSATLTVTQGSCMAETFTNITTSASSYADRTWTGDNGDVWEATRARTDRTLNGKAITTNGSGSITSPAHAGGMGTLKFNYVRDFSGTSSRTIEVWVNGVKIGSDITVSPSSDVIVQYSQEINIGGEVSLELRTSGSQIKIDDIEWTCYTPVCTPATITAFPTSGPANTIVTIMGTNFDSGSTVKFGTVTAVAEYISPTRLKAIVPEAANGNISVDTALVCDSQTPFTVIRGETAGCESIPAGTGSAGASDIFIYEVYDENGGNGGIVTLYNRTGATVDLAGYSIQKANDYGGSYTSYANLSGTIEPGAVAVIGVSASKCGYTSTGNGGFGAAGFGSNDGIRIMKGGVIIDDFKAPNYAGYYLKRKNGFLSPRAIFLDNEWTIQNISQNECLADTVAKVPVIKNPPVVTAQPSYSVSCDLVDASLILTATEGYEGGNALAYQWYVLTTSGGWNAVADGGIYSGATTRTLKIININGLNNYQYYCQVRENTQTCYSATDATQIKEASNTWTSNVWTNGTPVPGSKVIISGSYNTENNGALDVCDLTISAGGSIRIKPNFPVTVKKKITNNSSATNFIVENDANLIQADNVTNEGLIQVQRQVTDMNNVASQMDYVYWSSPVIGQSIKGTTGFSPNTPANGFLQYNESNDKFTVTADTEFLAGKGYAIRAENGANGYSKTYSFSGIPNNGNIQYQNLKWTNSDHGYNLVGNPYPSNIDFDLLHAQNSDKIFSTVWFWTNNNYTAGQVGSGYNGNNYAVYNGTGGSPATYNPENPYDGSAIPDGKIKVGQAFIIQAKQMGKDQPFNFSNAVRVTDDGHFYQKSVKNRFWLKMTSPSNVVNTILIGYVNGATDDYEPDFDSELFAVGSDSFYSLLNSKKLAIQGKSGHFSADDVIVIGNVFSVDGMYTVKLENAEGIFGAGQKIYLRDKLINKYFDLSNYQSYSFTASKGTDHNRFEIVYKEGTLAVNHDENSDFQIYRSMDGFVIHSSKILGNIELYDAGGRLVRRLYSREKKMIIDDRDLPHGVYVIKAENSMDLKIRKIIK